MIGDHEHYDSMTYCYECHLNCYVLYFIDNFDFSKKVCPKCWFSKYMHEVYKNDL